MEIFSFLYLRIIPIVNKNLSICLILLGHSAWGGEKIEISELKWKHRLLIWHSAKYETANDVIAKFKANRQCEIIDKKIKVIHFVANKNEQYHLPKFVFNKRGIWLIGLDGSVKYFSQSGFEQEFIFDLIDSMPMRQNEMGNRDISC